MPEKEVRIPIEKAALYAKRFVLPITALFIVPYLVIHQGFVIIEAKSYLYFIDAYSAFLAREGFLNVLFQPVKSFFHSFEHFGWLMLSMVPAVVLHELLHAFAAIVFAKGNIKAVSFGFDKKSLSPYTHCKAPLFVWQYRIVLVLPGIVLGVLPGILGIVFQSPDLLTFGIIYTFGALGDFLMLFILKNYRPKTRVKDHPTTLGFFVVE